MVSCLLLRAYIISLFLLSSVAGLFHVLDPAVDVYRSPVNGEVFGVFVQPDEVMKVNKVVVIIFDGQHMHSLLMSIQQMNKANQFKNPPAKKDGGNDRFMTPRRLKPWLDDEKISVMQAEVFIGEVMVKLGDRVKKGDALFEYVIRYYELKV